MPELAELKLTADFINRVAKDKVFHSTWKNPVHKGKGVFISFPFEIEAKSRGKELMLEICTASNFATPDNFDCLHLMMTMGMAGHFQWCDGNERPKHTHLSFVCDEGNFASLTLEDLAGGTLAIGTKKGVQILRQIFHLSNRTFFRIYI